MSFPGSAGNGLIKRMYQERINTVCSTRDKEIIPLYQNKQCILLYSNTETFSSSYCRPVSAFKIQTTLFWRCHLLQCSSFLGLFFPIPCYRSLSPQLCLFTWLMDCQDLEHRNDTAESSHFLTGIYSCILPVTWFIHTVILPLRQALIDSHSWLSSF